MKPRPNADSSQLDLFKAQFTRILDLDHPLVVLADKIQWQRLELALAECFPSDLGAPALSTRLIIGLIYLKHAFNESDESLLERWIENPYWQYFCGFSTMQHELPLHPTSLVKWRQRVAASNFGANAVRVCLAPLKLISRGSTSFSLAATAMTVRSRLYAIR
jgi:IS5 family transposase